MLLCVRAPISSQERRFEVRRKRIRWNRGRAVMEKKDIMKKRFKGFGRFEDVITL